MFASASVLHGPGQERIEYQKADVLMSTSTSVAGRGKAETGAQLEEAW